MNFTEIAAARQSCRKYDAKRQIPRELLDRILETARLSPSACNSQPYFFTVCEGDKAREVARATQTLGFNKFTDNAPVMLVITEGDYTPSAAAGAKMKHNDYRSIDIGIAAAYITAEATALGLGSCILGWFDNEKLKKICSLTADVRLVIALGYPCDEPRDKKRKPHDELIKYIK